MLSPKPCCARQCINTEKETGELKSGKELSPRGKPEKAHSWVPDAQSFALYLVDHKQLLRKQSKYTTARRIYRVMQMAAVWRFRNICEPPKGNLRKGCFPKASFQHPLRDLELYAVVSAALQLTWISFHT